MKLRHAPLLLVREMARLPSHKALVAETLERVIQRPDELAEFLAIYWKDGRQPVSAQVKKGLARAFRKFNEYALAKYDREGAVKLRDALFLSHSKPKDATVKFTKLERKSAEQYDLAPHETLYKRVVDRKLTTPDTWEVELSASSDKLESWNSSPGREEDGRARAASQPPQHDGGRYRRQPDS
jgi:60 kDa SS-A/Ro ribonucleoprotein